MDNIPIPICPKCGKEALMLRTQYGKRYYCCNLWAWGKYPLVNKTTHDLRKIVHSKFDPLWQNFKMSRREAYKLLSKKLQIPFKDCHIKLMDKDTLNKSLLFIKDIKKESNES